MYRAKFIKLPGYRSSFPRFKNTFLSQKLSNRPIGKHSCDKEKNLLNNRTENLLNLLGIPRSSIVK